MIKLCWWSYGQKLWRHYLFFKLPFLRKPGVAICADITKTITTFIKTIIKDSRKVKRIRNYVSNLYMYKIMYKIMYQSISVFLDISKFADFRWKILMSTGLKGYITWFIYFLDLPSVRYNCAMFHHCRIRVKDFREWGPFWSTGPVSLSSPEKAHLE